MASETTAFLKKLRSAPPADIDKEALLYTRRGFYMTVIASLITIFLAFTANKLAEQSVNLSKAAAADRSQVDSITKILRSVNMMLQNQQLEISYLAKSAGQLQRQTGLLNNTAKITKDQLSLLTNVQLTEMKAAVARLTTMGVKIADLKVEYERNVKIIPKETENLAQLRDKQIALIEKTADLVDAQISNVFVQSNPILRSIWNSFPLSKDYAIQSLQIMDLVADPKKGNQIMYTFDNFYLNSYLQGLASLTGFAGNAAANFNSMLKD